MLVSAALAALAVWLWMPGTPRRRAQDVLPPDEVTSERDLTATALPRVAPWLLAVGLLVLVGPPLGVALAVAAIVLMPPALRRLQSSGERHTERELARAVPAAIDLLVATLASGAPTEHAVRAVADAQSGPLREPLAQVAGALSLGAPADHAWASVRGHRELAEVADAFARSAHTGAPIAGLLAQVAQELRRRRQVTITVAARQAGVQAFIPLGLCFLPAFVLLAGVPMVVTMAQGTGLLDSLSP